LSTSPWRRGRDQVLGSVGDGLGLQLGAGGEE